MSQGNESLNNSIIINQLDELIESLELETQKAISMTILAPSKEAFEGAFKIMDEMSDLFKSITDDIVKMIAVTKIKDAFNDFEEKTNQIR